MKNQHTPGPWQLTIGENDAAIHTDATIARIEDEASSWKANAHLIAAAPYLLHALDLLLDKLNAHGIKNKHLVEAIEKAECAISKARGNK